MNRINVPPRMIPSFFLLNFDSRFKLIPRWMAGSCNRVPKLELVDSMEKQVQISYHEDLINIPEIQSRLVVIHESVSKVCDGLHKHIMTYVRRSKV